MRERASNVLTFKMSILCFRLLSALILCTITLASNQVADAKDDSLILFQKLFSTRRREHKDAVDRILSLKERSKQIKLVATIVPKIFEVLLDNRVRLENAGFFPGNELPTEEALKDAFANVLENTAFLGEILLHLPDVTHSVLRANRQYDLLVKWSVSFCTETVFLDNGSKKLLNLMAQELNLIEREPNFINPYAKSNRANGTDEATVPKPNTHKKKVKSKGPSLTRAKQEL